MLACLLLASVLMGGFHQCLGCRGGWSLYEAEEVCLKSFNERKTFNDAMFTCLKEGGGLVQIFDDDKNTFAGNLMPKSKHSEGGVRYSWIGVSTQITGEFGYTSGSNLSYNAWSVGEPDPRSSVSCAKLHIATCHSACCRQPKWTLDDCGLLESFICEKTSLAAKPCPHGWTLSDDKCYRTIAHQKMNQMEASSFCQQIEGSLAEVRNVNDIDRLKSALPDILSSASTAKFWVGKVSAETPVQQAWSYYDLINDTEKGFTVQLSTWELQILTFHSGFDRVFVCERPLRADSTCPPGWKLYRGDSSASDPSVCWASFSALSFAKAPEYCRAQRGFLYMPKSKAKFQHLKEHRPWPGLALGIGVRRSENGVTFEYDDGTIIPSCRVLRTVGERTLSAYVDCTKPKMFICERPKAY